MPLGNCSVATRHDSHCKSLFTQLPPSPAELQLRKSTYLTCLNMQRVAWWYLNSMFIDRQQSTGMAGYLTPGTRSWPLFCSKTESSVAETLSTVTWYSCGLLNTQQQPALSQCSLAIAFHLLQHHSETSLYFFHCFQTLCSDIFFVFLVL